MIEHISFAEKHPIVSLASEVVYLQKPHWCDCSARVLKMSLLIPRSYYEYDPKPEKRPCILFFCGGGFQKEDRLVWMPQLTYFAQHGYVVATADYSTMASTKFPEQLCDAKAAVRFLRTNAQRMNIDPERIYSMGESAGGQLALWLALTGNSSAYDIGDHLDQSSTVQGCVAYYPVTHANAFPAPESIRIDMRNFPDSNTLIHDAVPPVMLLHGTKDEQVPYSQSIRFHDAMLSCGLQCQLLLLDDANHSDPQFYEDEMKQRVLSFLDRLSRQ